MKTVSLIYGYSARNAGDYAITLGALDILIASGLKVKLFSRYCRRNKDFWESKQSIEARYGQQIELFESPFCLDRTDSLLSTIASYIDGAASVVGLKRNSEFKKNLLDTDLILFNGGNLFRCHSFIDYTRLQALLYPLRIAIKAKKNFSIFPQSASRLSWSGQRLLLPILKKADIVFFRESASYNYIHQFITDKNFKQTIDLAFHIDKKGLKPVERGNKIAITLRFHTVGDISYFPNNVIEHIFEHIGYYVKSLKHEYEFILVVQTNKDEEKSKDFAKRHNLKLIKSNSPEELLNIYSSVSLLIGMRLHSIILAMSVGTPCYGVFYKQWGLKNPGLMDSFHMPYIMLDENNDLEKGVEHIKKLLNHRDSISEKLLQAVELEREKMISDVKSLISDKRA